MKNEAMGTAVKMELGKPCPRCGKPLMIEDTRKRQSGRYYKFCCTGEKCNFFFSILVNLAGKVAHSYQYGYKVRNKRK